MNVQMLKAGLLSGVILFSAVTSAATCRSGSAAEKGSQAGYEQAKTAATAWSLQPCLSRIKKITVTVPEFPSLESIISQLENEICDAAVDKVNDQLPGNIDPWKNYSS